MADEITLRWNWTVEKGNLKDRVSFDSQTITLNTASPAMASGVMIAGTTYEAVPLGDLTTPRLGYFKNLDATNYIEVGLEVSSAFYPFLRLKAGQHHPVLLGATAIFVKANTAACKFEYKIHDD